MRAPLQAVRCYLILVHTGKWGHATKRKGRAALPLTAPNPTLTEPTGAGECCQPRGPGARAAGLVFGGQCLGWEGRAGGDWGCVVGIRPFLSVTSGGWLLHASVLSSLKWGNDNRPLFLKAATRLKCSGACRGGTGAPSAAPARAFVTTDDDDGVKSR